ncbi:MAG: hypothetical protein MZU95_05820 [Desulfomicrobium escambiense]|nr:hypothetical protein [Desulfomicrobium escambiense]
MLSTVENLYSFRTSMNRTMYSYRMIRLVLVTTAAYALTVFLLKNTRGVFFDSRIVIVLHMFLWAIFGITARMIILPWVYGYLYRFCNPCGSCALVVGNPSEAEKVSALIRKAPVYRQTHSVTTIAMDLPEAPAGHLQPVCNALGQEQMRAGFHPVRPSRPQLRRGNLDASPRRGDPLRHLFRAHPEPRLLRSMA